MSLKLQQTGTGGSGSGRRIGPASKTNRSQVTNDVIDVDVVDDKPISQIINQKAQNPSNETKSDIKKSLIPISTNDKNNQLSLSTTTTTPISTTSNEMKNGKESNSSTPSNSNDKKDNIKSTDKIGLNNVQVKISFSLPQPSQKETKSTNGHKNDDGNNKKANVLPKNGNEEQKDNKTKEDKTKITTEEKNSIVAPLIESEKLGSKSKKILEKEKKKINEEIISIVAPVIESEKPGSKSKKILEKEKKKINEEIISIVAPVIEAEKPGSKSKKIFEKEKKKINEEITSTNIDVLPQPTITPSKRMSQRAAAIQANASLSSLANEKELKGFNEIGDEEMDSLLLQIDTSEQIEKPTESLLTPTKNITSNLETKNEHENKNIETKKKDCTTQLTTTNLPIITTVHFSQSAITSTPEVKQNSFLQRPSSSSIRSISGRRSLHPHKEYSFQNTTNYRESYRKIQTELDCTGNTSLNVTVGSEIAQPEFTSSSSSFSFFGRGKKRDRTSPQQQTSQKSPEHCQLIDDNNGDNNEFDTSLTKRPRLDFSGFFGIVASPVTMLRARLSRAKIQSNPTLNDNNEEGVENFSGISGEKNEIILDNKGNCEDEDVEIEEISMKDDDENEENDTKNIKDKIDDSEAEDNEIIVTERENTRRMCLLM